MVIDLHTHSNASDGTDDPAAMPRLARAAGVDILGLTDHDTVAGWAAAGGAAPAAGVTLVRGMEFTTHFPVDPRRHPAGKSRVSVHLLGYLFNPAHPAIVTHIASMSHAREERAREIVDRLARDFPITWKIVQAHREPDAPIGRPHIADALVSVGVAANRSAVFRDILSSDSPYYVPMRSPHTTDAVRWIVAAGGKAVLAHPKALARGNFLDDAAIREIAAAGLFGIEVNHRDNPPELRPALADLARELDLAQFGASDYHGDGKPNRMGENYTSRAVYEQLRADNYLPVIVP